MLHRVINYQHVSIVLTINGVALQEYKEYNNLPQDLWPQVITGTTHYNKCLNIEYCNLHFFPYYSFKATLRVITEVIDTSW